MMKVSLNCIELTSKCQVDPAELFDADRNTSTVTEAQISGESEKSKCGSDVQVIPCPLI